MTLKALEILKHYSGSIAPITYTPKQVDEAIKELEELEEELNGSCDNCEYQDSGRNYMCNVGCNPFSCNQWELKQNDS